MKAKTPFPTLTPQQKAQILDGQKATPPRLTEQEKHAHSIRRWGVRVTPETLVTLLNHLEAAEASLQKLRTHLLSVQAPASTASIHNQKPGRLGADTTESMFGAASVILFRELERIETQYLSDAGKRALALLLGENPHHYQK